MTTDEKNKAILIAGYMVGQPTGRLYHGFSPTGKKMGISSSEAEVIKWCYRHLKENKSK